MQEDSLLGVIRFYSLLIESLNYFTLLRRCIVPAAICLCWRGSSVLVFGFSLSLVNISSIPLLSQRLRVYWQLEQWWRQRSAAFAPAGALTGTTEDPSIGALLNLPFGFIIPLGVDAPRRNDFFSATYWVNSAGRLDGWMYASSG